MTIAIAVKLGEYRGIITDTALICKTKNGESIRAGETEDKIFLKDDCAIFCSGDMGVCNHIRRHVLEMTDFSIENLVSYLRYLNNDDPIYNDDMAIIIVDNNKITGIKANNNFEPVYFDGESGIVSTGIFMVNGKRISSEEETTLVNNKFINYLLETKNATKTLVKIAKDFLNTEVGGKLKVFTYNNKLNEFELSHSEKVDNLLEEEKYRAKQIYNNKLFELAKHKKWEKKENFKTATFDGNIDASNISGSNLTGSTINIADNFIVDLLGNTTIKSGKFNIANNFIVDSDGTIHIKKGDLNINNNFIIDQLGNITSNGNFDLLGNIRMGGNITWDNPVVQYQYSTDNSSWHTTMTSSDKYRRESWDSGATWQNGYKFIAVDGINGSDANVNDVNVFNALTNEGKFQGIFSDENGKLYMNAQYIRSGKLSGVTIDVDTVATIGKKLIINADDFAGGIQFLYNDGTGDKVAEIYVDPAAKSLNLEADGGINIKSSNNGKVYINNAEFTGIQPKVVATFG